MAPSCLSMYSPFQEPNAEYMDKQLSATIAPLHWGMRGERSVDVAGELQEGGRFHRDKTREGEAVLTSRGTKDEERFHRTKYVRW